MTGLVPSIQRSVAGSYTYSITDVNKHKHEVVHAAGSTSHGLRVALTWMYPGVYALSCVVFVAALVFLKRDIRRAAEGGVSNGKKEMAGDPAAAADTNKVLVDRSADDGRDMVDP